MDQQQTQPTPTAAQDVRVSTLTGDRLCASCSYNLVGQPVLREAHYNMLIVRCPECGAAASVQEYPLLGRWSGRIAALIAAMWFLFLLFFFCGGCAALLGMSAGFTQALHTWRYRDWLDDQRVSEYNAANPASPLNNYWELPTSFDSWWAQQDADALFARAGGWPALLYWPALPIYLIPIALAFIFGCMWSVILIHWRRAKLHLASLVLLGVFAAVLAFIWTISFADPVGHSWDAAWRQVGLPLYAAVVFIIWLSFNLGLLLGRPIVRGTIRALLPPRLRAPFSILWIADGRRLPRA